MTSTALDECNSAIQTIDRNFQRKYLEFTTVLATLRKYKDHVAQIQRKIELVSKRKSSVKKPKRPSRRSNVFINDSTFKRANGKRSFYFNVQSNPYRHRTADFREINASGHKFLSCLDRPKTWNITDVDALLSGVRDSIINEKRALLDTVLKDIDELSQSNPEDERLSSALSQANCLKDFLFCAADAELRALLLHELNDRDFDWVWICRKYFGESRRPEDCQRTWHLVAKPSIDKTAWTPQEDVLLRRIVRKNGFQAWDKITEQIVPHRSEFLNFVRHQTKWKENHRALMKWTHDDSCKLLEMKRNTTSYPEFVSKTKTRFPNFSNRQICSHLEYLNSMSNKRKLFFSKRERFMVNSYRKRGFSVSSIARILGSRTRQQIRDYCQLSLKPIRGHWNRSEISDLLQAVKFIGLGRWTAVSEFVKERTPTQCRMKYRQLRGQHCLEPSVSKRYSIKNEQRVIKNFFKKPKKIHVSKSISQRIELFFLKLLQKKVTAEVSNPSLAEHVFSLLDFLNFKINNPAEYSQKINDWLISFPAADAPVSQDFDRFFEGTFVRFSSGLRLLKSDSIYTNISCKSDRVLPPSKCNINGFHTFSENYQQFVKKNNDINFESLWKQIDSVSKKKKEFTLAKMLWYHMLKAMFFWPLKLSTVMPEDLLKT